MKIVAVVLCQDKLLKSMGGIKCMNSFSFFHPDINIIHFGSDRIIDILWKYPGFMWGSMAPIVIKEVKTQEKADAVILLDADCLILSNMEELLKFDYDVAASLNDPESHIQDESANRCQQNKNLNYSNFVNAGFVAVTNDNLIETWIEMQKIEVAQYQQNPYRFYQELSFPMREQDVLNIIFHSGFFKSKILDPVGSKLIYGSAGNRAESRSDSSPRVSHVKNWKDIYEKNGTFYLDDKQIRRLHYGGGFQAVKIEYDLFSDEIATKLKRIAGE